MVYDSWDMKCKVQQKFFLSFWAKNHDHMRCCSCDMTSGNCNYFTFWAIFCPFTFLPTRKIKIKEKWKKHLEIPSYYNSVPKIMITCYTVPEIWHVTDVIVIFYFVFFLPFYLPNCLNCQNLKIMKKAPRDIIISQ